MLLEFLRRNNMGDVIEFPQLNSEDKQFLELEKQAVLVEEQRKRIEELLKNESVKNSKSSL